MLIMMSRQFAPIAHRVAVAGCDAIEALAGRAQETDCAVVEYMDLHLAFVNGAVMEAAQGYEIGELRFAAVRPMVNVMCVGVSSVAAAREAAALIARAKRAL